MGSLLSTTHTPPTAEQKRILDGDATLPTPASSEPLFLDEVKADPAAWSNESFCRTFQRFIGLLPDSPGEVLKKEQQYPWFERRYPAFVLNDGNRVGAVIVIQRLYRRYRRLQKWHEVGDHFLGIVRVQLAVHHAQEEENISVAKFRVLLSDGFSANKVCISGALKTIKLQLVLNAEAGECYLTWTPSRKKRPRINLHDVDQVIAVRKEGNAEAPRLSKKVSHRRGLIIVCKSYHRGRLVLEVSTKQERNLLLRGFQRLLDEMNSNEPALDDAGAIRKQLPRRQSVLEFFDSVPTASTNTVVDAECVNTSESTVLAISQPSKRGSAVVAVPVSSMDTLLPREDSTDVAASESFVGTEWARTDTKSIEHFYQTRFDDPQATWCLHHRKLRVHPVKPWK